MRRTAQYQKPFLMTVLFIIIFIIYNYTMRKNKMQAETGFFTYAQVPKKLYSANQRNY